MSTLSVYPGVSVEIEAFNRTLESALAEPAAAGATTITVYDASRWSAGQSLKVGAGDPQTSAAELATIGSISGNVVTLAAALARRHGVGTKVWRLIAADMVCAVENEDGSTAPSLSSVSTGRYRGTYATSNAATGRHEVEVTASGAATAVAAATFDVQSDVV